MYYSNIYEDYSLVNEGYTYVISLYILKLIHVNQYLINFIL